MNSLKFISFKVLMSTALFANAGTDLPYIGPDMSIHCDIKPSVNSSIDGGYLTNEDCTIVYVKPPRVGLLDVIAWAPNSRALACGIYNKMTLGLFKAQNEITETNDPAIRGLLSRKISLLEKFLNEQNNAGTALTTNVAFNLNWAELVTEYAIRNPLKNVRYLPISFSNISVNAINPSDLENSFSQSNNDRPAFIDINALRIDPSQSSQLPDFIRSTAIICNSNQNCPTNYLMGQSVGGTMGLTMGQTCPLWDETNSKIDENAIAAYLSATYSYFYHIQSKSFFRVALNQQNLLKAIKVALQHKSSGDLTAPDLAKAIDGKDAITITINPGFAASNPVLVEEARKEELKKYVLNAFLLSATDNLHRAIASSRWTQTTTVNEENCTRFLGIRISCSKHVYHIDIPMMNWDEVIQKMNQLGVTTGNAATDQTYTDLIMFDTSTFKPINAPKMIAK